MAHVPVIRRSMRPDEWTRVRMGWLRARIFETVREIEGWTIREGVQTGEAEYRMDDEAPPGRFAGAICTSPPTARRFCPSVPSFLRDAGTGAACGCACARRRR